MSKRILKYTIAFILSAIFSLSALAEKKEFIPIQKDAQKYSKKVKSLPKGAKKFTVDLPNPTEEKVVNAADFGLSENATNAVSAINKALEHCKNTGASKLILPKGTYKAFEEGAIKLIGFKDFTLDGQGSTIIYRKSKSNNVDIKECERVKVCNLNVDWDWATDPLASIVEVEDVKVDGEKSTVTFKFLEYDNFPNKNARMVNTSPWDSEAKCAGNEDGVTGFFNNPWGPKVEVEHEWLAPNIVRVHWHKDVKWGGWGGFHRYKKGMVLRMQHYYYHMNNFHIDSNTHLTMENINVYSCAGHAFVIGGKQQYWSFDNVNIKRPEGAEKRAITCSADHMHFTRSKGFFKMSNCEFGLGADDCINMHDCSGFARRHTDNSILTQNANTVHSWKAGDLIELRQGDFSPSGFKAQILKIVPVEPQKGIFELFFDEKIPEQTSDGFIMFNWEYDTHNILVENCKFWGNRARGILILARDVTIQNCHFYHHEEGAIKIETGYTFNLWSEGYGVNNVVIRNNVFENAAQSTASRDIKMNVYMKTDPSVGGTMYPILKNILIEKNKFINSFGYIAEIASTGNVTFRDNVISHTHDRKNTKVNRGTISVAYSSDIKIINNKFIESDFANSGITYDADTTKNFIFEGNKLVEKNADE